MKKLLVFATALSMTVTSFSAFAKFEPTTLPKKVDTDLGLQVETKQASEVELSTNREYDLVATADMAPVVETWNSYIDEAIAYAKGQGSAFAGLVDATSIAKVAKLTGSFSITVTAPDLVDKADKNKITLESANGHNIDGLFTPEYADNVVTYTYINSADNNAKLATYMEDAKDGDKLQVTVPMPAEATANTYVLSISMMGSMDITVNTNKIGTVDFSGAKVDLSVKFVEPATPAPQKPAPTATPTPAPTATPAPDAPATPTPTATPTPKPMISIKLDTVVSSDEISVEIEKNDLVDGFASFEVNVKVSDSETETAKYGFDFKMTLPADTFKQFFAEDPAEGNPDEDETVTLTEYQYELFKAGYKQNEDVEPVKANSEELQTAYAKAEIAAPEGTTVEVSPDFTVADETDKIVTVPGMSGSEVIATPTPTPTPTPTTPGGNPGGSGSGGGGGSVRPTATPTATATPAPTAEPGATATPAPAADAVTATRTEVDPTTGETKTVTVTFNDVKTSDWFAESVKKAFAMGIMNGTSDTEFSPNLTTTRGMIITVVSRLNGGATATEATNFADVAADQYYADAVKWGAANGIVKGYDENTYGPNDDITREQFAAIFYRYAQFKGYDVSAAGDISKFADADKVSDYAKTAIAWANGIGLMNGTDDNRLMPTDKALRCQVAKMIVAFDEWVASQAPKAE